MSEWESICARGGGTVAGDTLRTRIKAALAVVTILAAVTACDFSGPTLRRELLTNALVPTGVTSPRQVQLHNGHSTQTRDGITTETTLLPRRAHGDIDGDGLDDTAALVQTRVRLADPRPPLQTHRAQRDIPGHGAPQTGAPQTGAPRHDVPKHDERHEHSDTPGSTAQVTFVSVVVFRSTTGAAGGGAPTVSNALALGPGAQVHAVDVLAAQLRPHWNLHVTPTHLVIDYTLPENGFNKDMPAQQPHRRLLTARLTGSTLTPIETTVTTQTDTTAGGAPTQLKLWADPGSDQRQAAESTSSPSDIGSAAQAGVVAYGAIQRYQFTGTAGYRLALEVTSSQAGVQVAVRGDDGTMLVATQEGKHSFHGTVAKSQKYRVDVESSDQHPARYRLKIGVIKPRSASAAVPGRAESGKVLHFTFDDGPNPAFTDQILGILAKYNVKATFFVVGKNVAAHPGWVDRELAAGHVVANHSYTHLKLTGVSQQTFDDEVDRTQQAIGPRAAACLRPPYGAADAELRQRAANRSLTPVLWDVDTQDWRRGPPEEIAQRILDGAQSGNIVLMHDGGGDRSHTIQALEIALPKLVEQGWSFTPVCR